MTFLKFIGSLIVGYFILCVIVAVKHRREDALLLNKAFDDAIKKQKDLD